ncbi:MAG: DUF1549 domain-containing protein [Planctomycetes bacterium]|nr:DUF1549 domain-containing protein [Planctomycetota bacterium]
MLRLPIPPQTLAALVIVLVVGAAAGAEEPPAADYARDIRPLLRQRCTACHGALAQRSDLRLDTRAGIVVGGAGGPAVVPGDAAASPLLDRVASTDPAQRMPPEGPPLSAARIATLAAWIAAGAPGIEGEVPESDPRDHWAFRPPQKMALPAVADGTANPIDAFVEARLAAAGITPGPPADKATLLRRVALDLVGLPPTAAEVEAFLADESPDAYERVVDRLLASPQHAERQARHWMDVWRYADWHGRRHVPDVWNSAPQIFRWRDWIIASLDADVGYDRMVAEMLAADELRPGDRAAAVATGYLVRNWYALNPNDWMRANVEHVGKAFLGLTFHCAHCHDHKYDPIAQDDYFRFRAFFEPLGLRQDRLPGEADPGPFQEYAYSTLRKVQRLGTVQVFDKSPDAPTWFYAGGDERNRDTARGAIAPGLPRFLAPAGGPAIGPVDLPPAAFYPGIDPALRRAVRDEAAAAVVAARQALANVLDEEGAPDTLLRRDAARAALDERLARLAAIDAREAADLARYGGGSMTEAVTLARSAQELHRAADVAAAVAALAGEEVGVAAAHARPASDSARAGEIDAVGKRLAAARKRLDDARAAAAAPAGEDYPALGSVYPARSTGRRRALAGWITARGNPLTARVAMNHVWMRHFHAPLVATVFDFGRAGSPPTHPELLDWLAVEFMDGGWRLKPIHRLVVTSRAYRRASHVSDAAAAAADPDNRLLSRMNVGRMEAEVVRDSLLHLAGRLDPTRGGPELENTQVFSTFRRGLYYCCQPESDGRSTFATPFDGPDPADCYRRARTIQPQQALALSNSELVHDMAGALAAALAAALPEPRRDDHGAFAAAAFTHVLGRPPRPDEAAACSGFLAGPATDAAAARAALVRVLFNHNDFVAIR